MIGGVNPWATMWTSPRSTVRAVVNVSPKYGVFCLAWIYALQNYLYFASYWSFGLSFSFFTILLIGVFGSPLIGLAWIYFTGWVYYVTGKWLGGAATQAHLRTAIAWSKIPASISLLMWLILMIAGAETIFINGVSGPSTLFLNFILFILGVWSLVLLIQSVREVQGFSLGKTLLNLIFAWIVSWVFVFFIFITLRFMYINA